MSLEIRRVGPEQAAELLEVVRAAFEDRPPLDPPADALAETVESLAQRLETAGGLVGYATDGRPVGAVLLDTVEMTPGHTTVFLRRFGVRPDAQGSGIAHAMVSRAAALATSWGADEVAVLARVELPVALRFWRRQGFVETHREGPYVELRRRAATLVAEAPDAAATRALGAAVARELRAGDLVVLTGDLGAGKTTFTQGLGAGLDVRGDITSPTFVIARVHPALGAGPDLVHVDAYRIGDELELDDLDLDASLDEAVTVVEWGEGLAETLAESRLEVRLVRDLEVRPGASSGGDADLDPRRVEVTPVGPRWAGVGLDLRAPTSSEMA